MYPNKKKSEIHFKKEVEKKTNSVKNWKNKMKTNPANIAFRYFIAHSHDSFETQHPLSKIIPHDIEIK